MDGMMALGQWAAGSVWAPVAAWTVVAGGGWWFLRTREGVHPLARYRLLQALLFALPAALVVGWSTPVGRALTPAPAAGIDAVGAARAVGSGTAVALGGPTAEPAALGFGAIVALLSGLAVVGALVLTSARLARISLRLWELRRISGSARPVADEATLGDLHRLRARLGVDRPVALLEGPDGSVPLTFGWRRPVIVVPATLVGRPDERRMALVHELVHVARNDFAWTVGERVVEAVFAFHPLVGRLARHVERHREASCDLDVLATHEACAGPYAGLLLTLGVRESPHYAVAAGFAAPKSHLRERIETMKSFENREPSSRVRTGLAAVALLAATSLLGACFSFNDSVPEADDGPEAVVAEARHRVDALPAGEELDRALARLDAQIAYLASEIDEIDAAWRAAEQATARGEAPEFSRRLMTRAGLLQDMYEERVREFERLKLEQIGVSAAR